MRVFIVRHGQTRWNVEGRAQGHTDIHLDETGLRQAELLAVRFARHTGVRTIFTSDLSRSRATAEAIGRHLNIDVQVRRALREIGFGILEGKLGSEIHALLERLSQQQSIPREDVLPPESETLPAVWDRLATFVAELAEHEESAIVVGHGGSGAILMAQLMRGTLDSRKSFRFGNTGYYELERRESGHYVLLQCNVTSHLEELVFHEPSR